MDAERYLAANRRRWDERVAIHRRSDFYDVAGFLAGGSALEPVEREELGAVAGGTLLHLQCHFGLDTLSWARLGATVTGLDFSGEAVREARALAREAGLAGEFVEADVYDAVAALGGRAFDVVYTGKGALNWLPDVGRWAETAAALVAPGGRFYLLEFHPFGDVFDNEADSLRLRYPYFARAEPLRAHDPGSYADAAAETVHNEAYEWLHPLGEVVSALAAAGLTVEFLHEFDYTLYERFRFMRREGRAWTLPQHRASVPLLYSIRARKPAS